MKNMRTTTYTQKHMSPTQKQMSPRTNHVIQNKENQQIGERLLTISEFTDQEGPRNSLQNNYSSYTQIHRVNKPNNIQTLKYSTSHSKKQSMQSIINLQSQNRQYRQQNVLQQKKSLNYAMCAKAKQKSLSINQKCVKTKQFNHTPQKYVKKVVSNQKSVNEDKQVSSYQVKIKELSHEIIILENKNVELEKQNIRLVCQAQMLKKQEKLQAKVEVKTARITAQCQEYAKIKDQLTLVTEEIQWKNQQIFLLTNKNTQFKANINQLQTSLKEVKNLSQSLQNSIFNLQQKYAKSSQQKKNLRDQKAWIQEQYSKIQRIYEQTVKQSKRQIKIKVQQKQMSQQTQKILQNLKIQLQSQKHECKKIKEKQLYYIQKLSEYGQKIAFYQLQRQKIKDDSHGLQKVFEQIEEQSFSQKQQTQKCTQIEVKTLKQAIQYLQQDKQSLKQKNNQKLEIINNLQRQIKSLKLEITTITQNNYKENVAMKRQLKNELDDIQNSCQKTIKSIKGQYQAKIQNIQSSSSYQEDVTKKYAKQISQSQWKNQRLNNLQQSISEKNRILTDKQLKISELTHSILQIGENISKKQETIKSLQNNLKNKQKEISIIKKCNQQKCSQNIAQQRQHQNCEKQLRSDMIHLMKQKQNMLKKMEELQRQVIANQKRINQKFFQNDALKKYQQKYDKVLSQNKYLSSINNKIQQELIEYKKLLHQSEQKSLKVGKHSCQMLDQLEKLKNQVKNVNKQIQDKSYKLKRVIQQKQEVSRQIVKNTIKLQESKKQIKQLQNKTQTLNSQLFSLKEKMDHLQRQNRVKLDQKQSNSMMMLNNLNRTKISIQEIQKQNKYLKNRLQNKAFIEEQLLKMDTKYKNIEKQNQTFKSQVRTKQKEIKLLMQERVYQQSKINNTEQQRTKLCRQFQAAHSQLQQTKLFANQKQLELQQIKKSNSLMKTDISTIQLKYKQKCEEFLQITRQTEQFKKQYESQNKQMESVYNQIKEKYDKCKKELKKYRDKNEEEKLLIKNSYRYNQEIIQNCQEIINRCDKQPNIQSKMASKRQSLALNHRSQKQCTQKQVFTSKKSYNNVFECVQLQDIFQNRKNKYTSSSNQDNNNIHIRSKNSIASLIEKQPNHAAKDMKNKKYNISP